MSGNVFGIHVVGVHFNQRMVRDTKNKGKYCLKKMKKRLDLYYILLLYLSKLKKEII